MVDTSYLENSHYPAFWIELAKRAYADGYDQALEVIDKAVRLNPDKPADIGLFYHMRWFFDYWLAHHRDENAVPADLR